MICLDGIIFSLQQTGGISTCFRELFKRAVSSGLDAELLLYDNAAEKRVGRECIKQCRPRFMERYRDCRTPSTATLFHSSYYRLPANRNIPAVTTVHDFTYERFNSGIRRLVHSTQKFNAIRKAAAIICVSWHTRKDLLELLPEVNAQDVFVVHNGVSEAFHPLHDGAVSPFQRPSILFVGSRVYYKNFQSAVEAVARISDTELLCVGGGVFSGEELAFLEKRMPGRYRHRGAVSEEELNLLYNQSQCLLYPSSYEGFGIPVLEAMSAGCPVVALNCSSIPEVAGDAALLIDSAHPEALATAIERTANVDFRNDLRSKGFRQARRFSWDMSFSQTLKIYEKVIGAPCCLRSA